MINSRKDIRDFILDLETRFPVHSWQFEGFHIWPIIRLRLFFYLIKKTERTHIKPISPSANSTKSKSNAIGLKLKKAMRVLSYYSWIYSIKPKKYVFVAQDAHRVDFQGKRFNRFFDVLIDRYDIGADSTYLETDHKSLNKVYRGQSVHSYLKALQGYLILRKFKKTETLRLEDDRYSEFLQELSEIPLTKDFALANSKKKLTAWYHKSAAPKQEFFEISLNKLKPVQISVLCYYSEDIMMLLTVANRRGVKTVEMQHGPHSDVHLCYSHWDHMPKGGYGVLPRNFWCWDAYSTEAIRSWADKNELYATKIVGNPWVQFWKNKKENYTASDYILYSLQPNPVSIERLFSPAIIDLIASTKEPWFIRLHPRQLQDLGTIKNYLKDRNVLQKVNIDQATSDPLPQMISNAKLHVTHYSGSLIEAAALGKKTILFDPIGAHSFSQYIEDGMAVFLDVNDATFTEKFYLEVENSLKLSRNDSDLDAIHDLF